MLALTPLAVTPAAVGDGPPPPREVATAHLRHLNPFPADTGTDMRSSA